MGTRKETRIAAAIPVTVRGVDAQGRRFEIASSTKDVSASGARLENLCSDCVSGAKIEIETNKKKAWFRVQWVGEKNTMHEGQAGVRCLEPGVCIWDVQLTAWMPDVFDPANPDTSMSNPPQAADNVVKLPAWNGHERRHFKRRACRIEASVSLEGDSSGMSATVTDISASGCFLEMLVPLPVNSLIGITLRPSGETLRLRGRVQTSFVGMGMGVAFTQISSDDCEKLIQLANPPKNSPPEQTIVEPIAVAPPLPPQPAPPPSNGSSVLQAPTTAEALEAVVRVLFRKGLLERAELFDELARVKSGKA
jgi:PilZ domain